MLKRHTREVGSGKWVLNHRKCFFHQSERLAEKLQTAEEEVDRAKAMPTRTRQEESDRQEALAQAEDSRLCWFRALNVLAQKYKRLNSDNIVVRDGEPDVVLDGKGAEANREGRESDNAKGSGDMAASCREGILLHGIQVGILDASAPARRAPDSEDNRGRGVIRVPRAVSPLPEQVP